MLKSMMDKVNKKGSNFSSILSSQNTVVEEEKPSKGFMRTHQVNKWLRSQARSVEKEKTIKDHYVKSVAEIKCEK